ncbi:hypothetical protein AC069_03655 [Gardnerella vaginalis]|uniref:hypothetical protein n=1 Tax=Gardnerella vaginalis TaxID=2702 RepID=UPI0006608054|nr:hypothetical protein [Gardnerella vaginalis]KMT46812.1 hypothetical protein AC069_03655 [Gardnerella vaginalis]
MNDEMSDKIKELALKRDAAMDEMYKAMFVKQNAAADYREKSEIFNKIDEQLEQAKKEEAENDARN